MLEWFFQQAWRATAGEQQESYPKIGGHPALTELQKTEWNSTFERAMRTRLIVGSFRYGCFSNSDKWKYDFIAGIRKKLEAYERTGNTEHLVDLANYALLEFTHPSHPAATFNPEDDHEHCPLKIGEGGI